ncbi:MAG: hypothetical protein Q7S64_01250 [bacterium]|nr:hypothetical protein [bacterium]
MRLCSIVVSLMILPNLYGCGGSNPLNASGTIAGPITAVATNSDFRTISEVPVNHNRAEADTVTFANLNLQSSANYLLVGVKNNGGTESYRLMLPQTIAANTVTTSLDQLPTDARAAVTSVRLYQVQLATADDSTGRSATLLPTSRSADGKRKLDFILLHGTFANPGSMRFYQSRLPTWEMDRKLDLIDGVEAILYGHLNPIKESAAYCLSRIKNIPSLADDDPKIIIGHSQGGLVARYMVENLGYRNNVVLVMLLGAPNNGFDLAVVTQFEFLTLDGFTPSMGLLINAALFTVNIAANLTAPAIRDMRANSSFLKELNQPSYTGIDYLSIAGTFELGSEYISGVGGGSNNDTIVPVSSANWDGLANEAQRLIREPVGVSHVELPSSEDAFKHLEKYLNKGIEDNWWNLTRGPLYATTDTSQTYASMLPPSTSPTTVTVGQVVLAHPASRWDYGETGFWYGEGKWHAAAKRVDVGPPLEAVQMDGRNGTIKSGTSGRGFSYQRCQNGILINLGTEVYGVKGEFYDHYQQAGGWAGELGCLTTEQRYDQPSGVSGGNGEWAQFEGGFIAKFDGLTATVLGDFGRVWNTKGKGQGELGYPKDYRRAVKSGAPQFVNTTGGWGQYQPFEGGCIAEWSQTEHVITGGFNREYLRTGGPGGPLGYPQTAKRTGVRSGCSARYGEEQLFQFGRICELGINNAWAVYGEILKRYSGPEYRHGFPRGPSVNENHSQPFEELTINW